MGTWSREGVILFIADDNSLSRVSESGGNATPVTTLDASRSEIVHTAPQFLPDGKHFLYSAQSSKAENNAIYVASLDSKGKKLLLNVSSNPVYAFPGYLLFHRQGTLMAQPFDADRLQITGEAVSIVEGLSLTRSVACIFFRLRQWRTGLPRRRRSSSSQSCLGEPQWYEQPLPLRLTIIRSRGFLPMGSWWQLGLRRVRVKFGFTTFPAMR